MSELTITVTKSELIKAFEKWHIRYKENPDEFEFLDDIEKMATISADYLIELINEK